MNDYLGNLVARTLGHMPVIQPRLASRFEAVEPPATFGRADDRSIGGALRPHAVDAVEVEEEIEVGADRTSTIKPVRRTRRNSRPVQTTETEEFKPEGDNPVAEAAPKLSFKPAPLQPDVLGRGFSDEIKTSSLLAQQPPSILSETEHASAYADAAQTLAETLPEPSQRQTLVPTEARRADSALQTGKGAQREIEKSNGPLSEGGVQAQPLQRAGAPPAPLTGTASPLPQRIQREPAIKVTIGRVEVRAVLPTAPAPAVKSAEPDPSVLALPLDEYLRRRSNGEL